MGRTQLARTIAELKTRIQTCKSHKKQLLNYVENIKNKCLNKEITYSKYEKLINKKLDGKTTQEWLDYYDSYIEDCENRIKKQKRKFSAKKFLSVFLSIVFILTLIFSSFYLKPVIVGLIVQEQLQEFTQELDLEFTDSYEYKWQLEHLGKLQSVKLSGLIEEEKGGHIEIYLDNLLILDSSNLKGEEIKLTRSAITGFSVEETQTAEPSAETAPIQTPESAPEPAPAPEQTLSLTPTPKSIEPSEESYSEEVQEEVPQQTSPSQEELLPPSEQSEEPIVPSEQDEELTEEPTPEPIEKIPIEEPITEEVPENITKPAEIPENITQPTTEPPTPTKEPAEIKITIKNFKDICEQTCNLTSLDLEKTSYTLKIRVNNAKLKLNEIKYEITTTEKIPIERNITVPKNITEINITLPKNITKVNITEVNITAINLTESNITNLTLKRERIVIGKPVKWFKKIQLKEPGKVKTTLPKQAENITVSKIIEEKEETIEILNKSYSEEVQEEVPQQTSPSQEELLPPSEQSEEPTTFSKRIIEKKQQAKFSITGKTIEKTDEKPAFSISNFFRKVFSTITGRAVTTEEKQEVIEITIEDNATEYEITYETPAPQAFEKNISETKKQIIISGPDELNYTDILAYTELPIESSTHAIKLYHLTEQGKEEVAIDKYDLNKNGLIEYIEWTVPHLSNQTYELEITILNVQSYPMVGSNWTVAFNTTGKANLTITAFNGTNWSNTNENYDLKFLEIKCGSQTLEYEWINNNPGNSSVFIQDYECNETSYETSKVLTEGVHTIEFDFGGIKAYAYNTAQNLSLEISGFINGYNASVWLKTDSDSHSGFDPYDMESSPPPSNYSEFYSNITDGTEYHLVIDSWNESTMPRTLYLVYYISTAQTGTIQFFWESLQNTNFSGNFTYYEGDSSYSNPVASVNMRASSSYSDSITTETYLYIKVTIDKDATAPIPTITGIGGDTSAPYSTSDTTPIVTATTDENADCRASLSDESYDDMSNDIDCSGDGTQSHSCQFGTLSESASQAFYVACNDSLGNKNAAANNAAANAEIDASTPVQSSHNPASGSTMNISSPTITFSINENGDCRASLSDESYDDMSDNVNCAGDGGTSHSCGMSGLSEGSEVVYIACQDDTDVSPNKDTIGSNTELSYTVDTTPPSTSITSPEPGSWHNADFDVSYTDSDSGSGVNTSACSYRILESGTPTLGWTTRTCSGSTTIDISNYCTAQGGNTCTVEAYTKDNAGNTGPTTSRSFSIDTFAPSTNAAATNASGSSYTFNTWTSSTYVDVTLSCDDASGIGCDTTLYCTDTSDSCTPSTTYTGAVQISTEGTSYIRFKSNDTLNNDESVNSEIIRIDTTNPSTTASAVNASGNSYTFNTWTSSTYVDVTLSCDDSSGSGCDTTYYCTDTSDSCTPSTTYTGAVQISTEGTSYIRFYSTDNSGNGESVNSEIIRIDTTNPSTTASAVNASGNSYTFNTWTSSTYVDVTLSCDDSSGSGCDTTYYCTDTSDSCTPSTTYSSAVQISTEGTSYIRFRSIDNVDNTEIIDSRTIRIDTTDPSTTIDSPAANSWQSADFDVSYTDSDTGGSGLSTCYYRILDDGTQSLGWTTRTCSGSTTIDISQYCTTDGSNTCTVEAYAIDSVGNNGSSSAASRSFSIDTGPPGISDLVEIPSDPATYSSGASYEFRANVSDANLDTVTFEFDGTPYSPTNISRDTYSYTLYNLSTNSSGYNYMWYATDTAGNTSSLGGTYTINKATPSFSTSVSATITEGTASDYSGSESNLGDGGCSYSLTRNGTQIDTGSSVSDTEILNPGNYTYNYSTSGCTNYSAGSEVDAMHVLIGTCTGTWISCPSTAEVGESFIITYGASSQSDPLSDYPWTTLSVYQTNPTPESELICNESESTGGGDPTGTYQVSITETSTGTRTYEARGYACFSGGGCCGSWDTTDSCTVTIQDTIPPNININSPLNTTYSVLSIDFNVSSNENLAYCVVSLNNWATNYTMTINASLTGANYTNTSTADGSYIAKFWCNDTANNINNSENVTFSISTNNVPNTPTVSINSTDLSNKSSQDLNCFATITDPDSDNLNVTVQWYKDAVLNLTLDYNNSYTSGSFFNATLNYANTSSGDIWKCGMRLYDGKSYSNWGNSSNLTILNTEPQITTIYNSSINLINGPNEAPSATSFIVNFTAYDPDGAGDLNTSSARINVTLSGEETRENLTCSQINSAGDYANYTCNITMWWWDGSGTWTITASIKDNNSNSTQNSSATFYVGERKGFVASPSALTWSGISPGTKNHTSNNDPIIMNNTGNADLTQEDIQINATNLKGEENNAFALWAGNFSVSVFTGNDPPVECNASSATMSAGAYTNITNATLPAGNYTINDGRAQEELYFCIKEIGAELTTQAYSTSEEGSWTLRVLLTVLTIGKIKRKRKRKQEKKNLIKALNLMTPELRKEFTKEKQHIITLLTREIKKQYKLTNKEINKLTETKPEIPITIFSKKLGALESVVKYMKENLNLSYRGIANLLNRNERTIWTAYNKAKKKQPEGIKIEKTKLFLTVSIFNKELTILESTIIHLKQKHLKYNEIANLLNRDQRNIWTIYSRAVKKIKMLSKVPK